jgi:hypothetical protein
MQAPATLCRCEWTSGISRPAGNLPVSLQFSFHVIIFHASYRLLRLLCGHVGVCCLIILWLVLCIFQAQCDAILKTLAPPGGAATLHQDLNENRYMARYKCATWHTQPPHSQADLHMASCSRSYKLRRSTEGALQEVLSWLWRKHAYVSGDFSVGEATAGAKIASLSAEQRDIVLNPGLGALRRGRA